MFFAGANFKTAKQVLKEEEEDPLKVYSEIKQASDRFQEKGLIHGNLRLDKIIRTEDGKWHIIDNLTWVCFSFLNTG